jgi:hypothetical protein
LASSEDQEELHEVYGRLQQAGRPILEQGETVCCYAQSEKSWIEDPAGISWETFFTHGESTKYGDGTGERGVQLSRAETTPALACCGPKAETEAARACCD